MLRSSYKKIQKFILSLEDFSAFQCEKKSWYSVYTLLYHFLKACYHLFDKTVVSNLSLRWLLCTYCFWLQFCLCLNHRRISEYTEIFTFCWYYIRISVRRMKKILPLNLCFLISHSILELWCRIVPSPILHPKLPPHCCLYLMLLRQPGFTSIRAFCDFSSLLQFDGILFGFVVLFCFVLFPDPLLTIFQCK